MLPRYGRRDVGWLSVLGAIHGRPLPEDQGRSPPRNQHRFEKAYRSQSLREGPIIPHREGAVTDVAVGCVRLYRLCYRLRLGTAIEGDHCGAPDFAIYE